MIVGVFVFGGIALVNLGGIFSPIRQAAWYVIMPFVGAAHSFGLYVSDMKNAISSIGNLKKENSRLYEENQKLQSSIALFQDMKRENEYLRSQFGMLPRDQYELESAAVIGYSPNSTDGWLLINKGSKDGVREDMPVIARGTVLIGKVENTQYASSRIQLLTNAESVVNVRTIESQSKGVVKGHFGIGLVLDMVLQTDIVREGDRLVTSELGSGYPAGLLVGEIHDVHSSENNLYQQATIISPVSFFDIRAVSVIKSSAKGGEK